MRWILESNPFGETGHDSLRQILQRRYYDTFALITIVPFTHRAFFVDNSDGVIKQPEFTEPCIAFGSTAVIDTTKIYNWQPGIFYSDNFDFTIWREKYGDLILNSQARVMQFQHLAMLSSPDAPDNIFIRPCAGDKIFPGMIINREEYARFLSSVILNKCKYKDLKLTTPIIVSPVHNLYHECRFWIVDGKIATYSTYKVYNKPALAPSYITVPIEAIEFARNTIKVWQPARAYCLDIVYSMTDMQFKIMEPNCINCAGFLGLEAEKLVDAIEAMEF